MLMRRIICVASGKGGVGKTVSAINLSMALHDLDENCIVVDADLNNPNIGLHLGIYGTPSSINDVLERDISVFDSLHVHKTGLRVIPASISLYHLHTDPVKLTEVFQDLEGYIILDCAPGYGREVMNSLEACDEVIVVTNPNFPAVVGCMRFLEVAREMHKSIRGIILNMSNRKEISDEEIQAICNEPIIGKIPFDHYVEKSIHAKIPVVRFYPNSKAAIEFKRIAAELAGRDFTPPRFLSIRRIVGL